MSDKTLRASLYFLGGVTVLYLLVTLLKGGDGGGPTEDSGLAGVLGELDGEWLTRVELAGPEETIDLSKDGGVWTVNGFEADSAAIARFLRAVDEVEVGSVAATNPANHERMGVTAESAWTMTVDGTTTVLLGNSGNRYRTFYARLPEADEVSLVEGDLRSAATRPLYRLAQQGHGACRHGGRDEHPGGAGTEPLPSTNARTPSGPWTARRWRAPRCVTCFRNSRGCARAALRRRMRTCRTRRTAP